MLFLHTFPFTEYVFVIQLFYDRNYIEVVAFVIIKQLAATTLSVTIVQYYLSLAAATPGSSLPSKNSREAPPPVEI